MLSQYCLNLINLNVALIPDAIDLRPTLFQVTDLDYDIMRPDTPSAYHLQVAVSVMGKGVPPNVSGAGREQFTWSYVLSTDTTYNVSEDVVILPERLSDTQRQLLQVCCAFFMAIHKS